MKKIIAILLVLVLTIFSFAACNKDDDSGQTEDNNENVPMEKFDEEKLKETWTAGEISFPNGEKLLLPCTVKEFVETSGMKIRNEETYANNKVQPDKTLSMQLDAENAQIKISCKNTGTSDISYLDATVTGFSFFNSVDGNKTITVAAGLTVGITRVAVESALGIPKGNTSEDKLYTYKSKVADGQQIRMNVSFNSDGIVNSISYKLDN